MTKKTFTAKTLSVYHIAGSGIIVSCTGIRKQLTEKRVRKLKQKSDDRILNMLGIPQ